MLHQRVGAKSKSHRYWPSFAASLLICMFLYPYVRKTDPALLFRGIVSGRGMSGVQVDDLVDDVRSKRQLRGVQEWSADVMSRYRVGHLLTNGPAAYWSGGTIELAP